MMIILGSVIGLLAVIAATTGPLISHRNGRWLLLFALAIVPLVLSGATLTVGMHESTRTSFCMGCHEMEPYGKSLFVDKPEALSAMHYQKRLVDRDSACFTCHTDYAMFGNAKAKLNGLRHVWVHYLGTVPKKIELYQPYPNSNCLHCHDDSRLFLEKPAHVKQQEALLQGTVSCTSCHSIVHDLEAAKTGPFWSAP